MAFLAMSTAPSRELYEQVSAQLGGEPPAGLLVHAAAEVDGAVQIVDIWESQEAMAAFAERIVPVIMAAAGGEAGTPPTPYEIFDLVTR